MTSFYNFVLVAAVSWLDLLEVAGRARSRSFGEPLYVCLGCIIASDSKVNPLVVTRP